MGAPSKRTLSWRLHQCFLSLRQRLGRNAMAVYQNLMDRFGFSGCYHCVRRFIRTSEGQANDGSTSVTPIVRCFTDPVGCPLRSGPQRSGAGEPAQGDARENPQCEHREGR